MSPRISIIIPVFNGGQTVGRCLESVLRQTFEDFECVIVDDGSTDESLRMIEQCAGGDLRIRIISTPNAGVSPARNVGLAHACGDYLTFLDCDDYLEPLALEMLERTIVETGADVAVGHLLFEDECGKPMTASPPLCAENGDVVQMSPQQAVEIMFGGTPFGGHLHGKLLRTASLAGGVFQEDVFIYEDMLYLLHVFHAAKTVAYIPAIVHHYCVTEAGAMAKKPTARKASSLKACNEMLHCTQQWFPSALCEAKRFAVQNALWLLQEMADAPFAVRREAWARQAVKDARLAVFANGGTAVLPRVQRLFCAALRMGWPIFFVLYRIPYRIAKAFCKE